MVTGSVSDCHILYNYQNILKTECTILNLKVAYLFRHRRLALFDCEEGLRPSTLQVYFSARIVSSINLYLCRSKYGLPFVHRRVDEIACRKNGC